MMPKFEVGEVVILVSESSPEMNGEYSVGMVVLGEERKYACPTTGTIVNRNKDSNNNAYQIIGAEVFKTSENGVTFQQLWHECALRKKHQTGEMSFRNLMQTLKDPSHA